MEEYTEPYNEVADQVGLHSAIQQSNSIATQNITVSNTGSFSFVTASSISVEFLDIDGGSY